MFVIKKLEYLEFISYLFSNACTAAFILRTSNRALWTCPFMCTPAALYSVPLEYCVGFSTSHPSNMVHTRLKGVRSKVVYDRAAFCLNTLQSASYVHTSVLYVNPRNSCSACVNGMFFAYSFGCDTSEFCEEWRYGIHEFGCDNEVDVCEFFSCLCIDLNCGDLNDLFDVLRCWSSACGRHFRECVFSVYIGSVHALSFFERVYCVMRMVICQQFDSG